MATTNNMAPKDRTALAVETGRAKEGQASLTRLQRAIGLKQRVQGQHISSRPAIALNTNF